MKYFFGSILLLFIFQSSFSQNIEIDSLRNALKHKQNDTERIVTMYKLSLAFQDSKPDSALLLAEQSYFMAKKITFIKGESWSLSQMAYALNSLGNFPKALEYYLQQLRIEETRGYPDNIVRVYLNIALLYESAKDYDKAIGYAKKADAIINANEYEELSLFSLLDIGEIYEKKNILDTALDYTKRCYLKSITAGNKLIEGNALNNLGNIYLKSGNFAAAYKSYTDALPVLNATGDYTDYAECTLGLAKLYLHNGLNDSAIFYGKKSFDIASQNKFLIKALDASSFLAQLYKKNKNADSAFAYQQILMGLKDSVESSEKINQFKNIAFAEQMRVLELNEEKTEIRNKIKIYGLLAGIVIFIFIAFLLIRINRIRKKTNIILEKQKDELQSALAQLKNTQAQLIQSEKMASLGELTAGIAHEIQNPLNFVTNFSEVNADLIEEMKDELDKGNIDEVKAIANDIADNSQKINHHGKRADAIVKGMLQHSRKSAGQKELTDINALAAEYLRLSYNGIIAKNKSFNATIQTDFDEHIGKINLSPQDIGRVLLNLYNNAFYAINEKAILQGESDFQPSITVKTKKEKNYIAITVSDNGNGISQQVLDKIFQPFFTTKPTGEGTGLGLSLSYDIIKTYGGTIEATTRQGEGATFAVNLPLA